ncbi:MAG TPA: SAM-dependent methyltransferase, partial [Ramlibacter sp.]|nr:SAM-dependent methyltransferase [Ramlibacter sp.]
MDTLLLRKVESRLAQLPAPLALGLPGGERVGPTGAAVTLGLRDWTTLATLAAGQIGRIAEDYVENRVDIEGRMRDVMAVAAGLLPGTPVNSDTHWWTQVMRRAKSLAAHTQQKDALQVQFHYDVSDD